MLYIWFLLIHFHFPQLLLLLPLFIRPPFFVQISRLNSVAGYIAEHRKHFSCCFRLGWMVNGRRGLHNCECDWRKMQRRRKKKRGTIWHVIIGKRERIRTPKWSDNDPIDTQALYTRFYASVLFTIRVYIAIELASFIFSPHHRPRLWIDRKRQILCPLSAIAVFVDALYMDWTFRWGFFMLQRPRKRPLLSSFVSVRHRIGGLAAAAAIWHSTTSLLYADDSVPLFYFRQLHYRAAFL